MGQFASTRAKTKRIAPTTSTSKEDCINVTDPTQKRGHPWCDIVNDWLNILELEVETTTHSVIFSSKPRNAAKWWNQIMSSKRTLGLNVLAFEASPNSEEKVRVLECFTKQAMFQALKKVQTAQLEYYSGDNNSHAKQHEVRSISCWYLASGIVHRYSLFTQS